VLLSNAVQKTQKKWVYICQKIKTKVDCFKDKSWKQNSFVLLKSSLHATE